MDRATVSSILAVRVSAGFWNSHVFQCTLTCCVNVLLYHMINMA